MLKMFTYFMTYSLLLQNNHLSGQKMILAILIITSVDQKLSLNVNIPEDDSMFPVEEDFL